MSDLTGTWQRDATDYTTEWQRPTDYTTEWQRPTDYTTEWQRPTDYTGTSQRSDEWRRRPPRQIESSRAELSDQTDTWTRTPAPRAISSGSSTSRDDLIGSWRDASDHTGQWHRGDDPDSWPAGSRTGARKRRAADVVRPDPDPVPVDPWQAAEPGRDDGFWSGTRLAGDDPRWVEPPESAPRSPAVAFPSAPRSRSLPESTRRPRYEPPSRHRLTYRIDDELIDADQGGYLSSLLYTAAWYAVPVMAFLIWSLTLDGTPASADCIPGIDGGCVSARAQAINSLVASATDFAYALLISLVLAVSIRWLSGTWRASSVGLAAAVIGGGMSTVLASAISGQPIG
ncbi:hypothetical protein O7632_03005 [Solwaraspora sp. WMMD406]|uniref:hypothetical protein n=1 Tax=Solwaraspora sp. WMMD406 TaxID=3016095 RepID=UPI002416EDB8|nr:hypothetical protein [Solwaraspora sp. WMMD406]MDG4763084.1 hypothetical protein [Solwaraspora sp. WMMD406]